MNFIYKSEIIDYTFNKSGKGSDTILFLHGWGGDKNSFYKLINLLQAKFNILTITLPTITPTINSWDMDDYINIIESILKVYSIDEVIIVCHSFGFRLAPLLKKFVKIKKIVVTGGAGIKTNCKYRLIENRNNAILLKNEKFKYLYNLVASSDYKNLTATNKITFKNMVNFNTIKFIKFDCPMLLFWGTKDKETPIKFAKIIKRKNNAKLIKTDSDHFAYIKKEALFLNHVNQFLNL